MSDQLSYNNPVTRFERIEPPKQNQPEPGLDADLVPQADIDAESYRGTGRLTGRKALVTGADSGIGAAVAVAFAREGADVALAYLPDEEQDAQRVAGIIEAEGRTAVMLPGDLADERYCTDLVDQAVKGLGGLDALVNNAGRQISVPSFEDVTDEQWAHTYDVNLHGMVRVTRAALPHLSAGARIVNSTSIQAYDPSDNLLDYSSTKATINTFSKGLATQLAPEGIRVNAVAPGPIWTPLQVSEGQPKEALPVFGHNTPLGRAGQPVELAPAYVFLTSPESSYVVGSTIHVNGGMTSP